MLKEQIFVCIMPHRGLTSFALVLLFYVKQTWHIHTYTHTYLAHTHTHTHTNMAHTHTHTHKNTHTHTRTHTHTHKNTHTHTHTLINLTNPLSSFVTVKESGTFTQTQ